MLTNTFVAIARQEALTKAIQERLAKAAPKDDGPSPDDSQREPMAPAGQAKKEKQQAKVIEIRRKESAA